MSPPLPFFWAPFLFLEHQIDFHLKVFESVVPAAGIFSYTLLRANTTSFVEGISFKETVPYNLNQTIPSLQTFYFTVLCCVLLARDFYLKWSLNDLTTSLCLCSKVQH